MGFTFYNLPGAAYGSLILVEKNGENPSLLQRETHLLAQGSGSKPNIGRKKWEKPFAL
ncbi:MAG TPA: hypothetical protein VHA56_18200 [Mucilaginibacter sp.]|nr:hypothetical protein [Mucilaginibacter sp.]